VIEPILLTTTRLETFSGANLLTQATGFFFERDGRLFLLTSRHVLIDEASAHHPDRLEIELHIDPGNIALCTRYSIPLRTGAGPCWREGSDAGGMVDIAAVELDRTALPPGFAYRAFTPGHLLPADAQIEVGTSLLVVGFPLGFQDTLHRTPVVRQAVIASSFGFRFQGQGYFLTDARTHRGLSGAPVVTRLSAAGREIPGDLPWTLLGVHSARLDILTRDQQIDEALGLNCAWYADIVMTLTAP
jgi:hypothetical protein